MELKSLNKAYYTEEVKQHEPKFYSANKIDSRMHKSKLRHNQPYISDIRKSLNKKKITESNGKWTSKKLDGYITTDHRIYGSGKVNTRDIKYKSPDLNANSSKLLMKTTVGVFDQSHSQNSIETKIEKRHKPGVPQLEAWTKNPISASSSKNANFRIRPGQTLKHYNSRVKRKR